VAVSVFAALDETLNQAPKNDALTQSKVGGNVSQADLSIHAQVSRSQATELMTAPAFSVSAKKMAMWLFIIADSATFAGCLVAYGFIRNATPDWPRPFHSITNVALMTFILLTSSLTMIIAVQSAQKGDKAGAFRWTMITAVAGILFAVLHIREWMGMIGEGATLFHNPWGTPLFGSLFYSITGLHLLHVTCGVIALIAVGLRYQGGRYNADDIEITGLYWHFVDLVWMFVVPLVYLLNLGR
jgi:cytochrome c oxidase subunit III